MFFIQRKYLCGVREFWVPLSCFCRTSGRPSRFFLLLYSIRSQPQTPALLQYIETRLVFPFSLYSTGLASRWGTDDFKFQNATKEQIPHIPAGHVSAETWFSQGTNIPSTQFIP